MSGSSISNQGSRVAEDSAEHSSLGASGDLTGVEGGETRHGRFGELLVSLSKLLGLRRRLEPLSKGFPAGVKGVRVLRSKVENRCRLMDK